MFEFSAPSRFSIALFTYHILNNNGWPCILFQALAFKAKAGQSQGQLLMKTVRIVEQGGLGSIMSSQLVTAANSFWHVLKAIERSFWHLYDDAMSLSDSVSCHVWEHLPLPLLGLCN